MTRTPELEKKSHKKNKRNKEQISGKEEKNKKMKKENKGEPHLSSSKNEKHKHKDKKQRLDKGKEEKESVEKEKGMETITDERFKSALHDPMYRKMKKKESKIEIDSRFEKMFKDGDFAGSGAPVDKRGKVKSEKQGKSLLMHYYLNQDGKKERKKEREEEESESEELEEEEEREGMDLSDSDDESGSTDYEDDQESVNSDICRYLMANHEDTPLIDNETHRLAVVNLDWDHVKALDLYMVMNSCLPKGGRIASVSVYPSEFGLQCMEIEAKQGPSALFHSNKISKIKNENNDDGGDDDDDDDEDDDDSTSESDSDDDNDKFRSYELNKLRYYFAVVVCDSSSTANHLYKTLDGTEFLKTSNVFDLRFIPDSMDFTQPPRDSATEAPVNYKEPEFETRALQHSRVKLTWDDDVPERKKILRRKFNPDQLDELDHFLHSTDEESEDEEEEAEKDKQEAAREKYLSLLQSNGDDGEKDDGPDDDGSGSEKDGDGKGEMEITFNTDLEALGRKMMDKRARSEETVWESVLRKRKEKRKLDKSIVQHHDDHDGDDDSDDDHGDDDFFMDDDSDDVIKVKVKGKADKSTKRGLKGKKDETLEREREASRAELELLFADEEEGKSEKHKGYNMKRIKAKGAKNKNKKGKNNRDGDNEQESEEKIPEIDAGQDPRFVGLFSSHLFALDPTDPQYKRSAPYLRQRSKKNDKSSTKDRDESLSEIQTDSKSDVAGSTSNSNKNELAAAIRSLKTNLGSLNNCTTKGSR